MANNPGSDTVCVLGLGLMGTIFARHFLTEGKTVAGYDPEPDRRNDVAAHGGAVFESVAEAVADAELVLLSLPNSIVMLEVCDQIIAAGVAPRLIIDTTTGDPNDSILAAAKLSDAGHRYVDATVSGNAAQFGERDVIFMVGGNPDDVLQATELLSPLARRVYPVGGIAAGSRAKLVVNHVLSINRTAVAEGLTVAEKAGLDLDPMLEILRDSAAYSRAMDIWGRRMVTADYDPPASRIRQSHKDSRLINAHAEELGASHALVAVVRGLLSDAEAGGLGNADNSSMMELMRRRADLSQGDAASGESTDGPG